MASESTGTHKDPVTGEMISKTYVVLLSFAYHALPHPSIPARSELKRREKAREKEAKKAERAAAAPPKPAAAAKSAAAEEEELNPNVCPLTFALAAVYPPPPNVHSTPTVRPLRSRGHECTLVLDPSIHAHESHHAGYAQTFLMMCIARVPMSHLQHYTCARAHA